jgi:hypothetical protein
MSMASEPRGDGRSLTDLLGSLASDLPGLFRKEIALAKAEAGEKLQKSMVGVEMLLAGAVLGIAALVVLLGALVSLLTAFLVAQGMAEHTAGALSAFVVAMVVGIVAWVTAKKGLSALSADNLKLERTAASLGRDADVVKERL